MKKKSLFAIALALIWALLPLPRTLLAQSCLEPTVGPPSGHNLMVDPNCISLPGSNLSNYQIPGSSFAEIYAGKYVNLQPGFRSNPSTTGAPTIIRALSCADYSVAPTNGWNGNHQQFRKLELDVQLPLTLRERIYAFLNDPANTTRRAFANLLIPQTTSTQQLNPFDLDDVDIEATFRHSSGAEYVRKAFFCPQVSSFDISSLPSTSGVTSTGINTNTASVQATTLYDRLMLDDYKIDDGFLYYYSPPGTIGKHKCMEFNGTNLPGTQEGWTIDAGIAAPFKVRFSPPKIGNWTVSLRYKIDGVIECQSDACAFTVSASSSAKGFLERSSSGNMFQFSETGEYFHPMGYNIWSARPGTLYGDFCPQVGPRDYMDQFFDSMDKLDQSGGNFFRVGCDATHFNIEWENLGNYIVRMGAAAELDEVVNQAESKGLYFILTLFSHHDFQRAYNLQGGFGDFLNKFDNGKDYDGNRSGGFGPHNHWYGNPYYRQVDLPGNSCHGYELSIYDMFVPYGSGNPLVEKSLRNHIQYYLSRWGYSTSIAAWEIMDEVQQAYSNHTISNISGISKPNGGWVDYFKPVGDQGSGYRFKCDAPNEIEQINPITTQVNTFSWLNWAANLIKPSSNSGRAYPQMLTVSQAGDPENQYYDNNSPRIEPNYGLADLDWMDIFQVHSYTSRFDANTIMRTSNVEKFATHPKTDDKAFLFGEMGAPEGYEIGTPIEFHNALWATNFMGGAGPGLSWYWNRIDGTYNPYGISRALRNQTNNSGNSLIQSLVYQPSSPCSSWVADLGENGGRYSLASLTWLMNGRDMRPYSERYAKTYSTAINSTASPLSSTYQNNQMLEVYAMQTPDHREAIGWLHNRTYWALGIRPHSQPTSYSNMTRDFLDDFFGNIDEVVKYVPTQYDPQCTLQDQHNYLVEGAYVGDLQRCSNVKSYNLRGQDNSVSMLNVPKADYFDTQDNCSYIACLRNPPQSGCTAPATNGRWRSYPTDFFDANAIASPTFHFEGLEQRSKYSVAFYSTRSNVLFNTTGLPMEWTGALGGKKIATVSGEYMHTDPDGVLEFEMPFPLDDLHPDVAFVLTWHGYLPMQKTNAVGQIPLEVVTMSLAPNPTRNSVQVTLKGDVEKESSVALADVSGKVILQLPAFQGAQTLDISALPAGLYFVTYTSPTTRLQKKLVVQ